jgi:hypothetical protein
MRGGRIATERSSHEISRVEFQSVKNVDDERLAELGQAVGVESSGKGLAGTGSRPVEQDAAEPCETNRQHRPAHPARRSPMNEQHRWTFAELLDTHVHIVASQMDASLNRSHTKRYPELPFSFKKPSLIDH